MVQSFIDSIRLFFEGDSAVRRAVGDPAVMAELLLLFRVALADGRMEESELVMLKRISREAFGIEEDSFAEVVRYLHEFGYETTGRQALEAFKALPFERKQELVGHMEAIAKADEHLDTREIALIRRTIAILNEQNNAA